ncbi:hypothetical protein HDV05_001851, partial [Chytridiales sp. JEL 0842]
IRLLEKSIPPVGSVVKNLDLTETSGLGLLGEMSVAELQERLWLAKTHVHQLESEKREEILKTKRARLDAIALKIQEIEREREERKVKRSTPALASSSDFLGGKVVESKELKELQEKIAAKKAARLATQKSGGASTPSRTAVSSPSVSRLGQHSNRKKRSNSATGSTNAGTLSRADSAAVLLSKHVPPLHSKKDSFDSKLVPKLPVKEGKWEDLEEGEDRLERLRREVGEVV